MNKKILTIALALSLPLAVAASAGDKGPDDFAGHRGDRVERLAKELDLTAEQKVQLQAVFQQEHEKRKAMREETHSQIQGLLNQDQMVKFEELRKNRHEKWQKHRQERRQHKSQESMH